MCNKSVLMGKVDKWCHWWAGFIKHIAYRSSKNFLHIKRSQRILTFELFKELSQLEADLFKGFLMYR